MPSESMVKAVILNRDKGDERVVECLFNPKEYSFAKQNQYKPDKVSGSNVPKLEFSGGGAASLTMELFFDTFAAGKDVRKEYTDKVWNLMAVDDKTKDKKTGKGRPPKVRFQWGQAWTFDAVIEQITQKFTLFLQNGTPVRATLNVTFRQVEDEKKKPKQNPTSGGVGGERLWTVADGDTLAWIAYKEYGDTKRWRSIAEANRLTNVRRLTPGTVLVIPNG